MGVMVAVGSALRVWDRGEGLGLYSCASSTRISLMIQWHAKMG